MSIYLLNNEIVFPDPNEANSDGLLAVGGDLRTDRIIAAYKKGIFPWYEASTPILWWSPDPRMVLFPHEFKRHKTLRRLVEKQIFKVTFDNDFESVMHFCAHTSRMGQEGTWITQDMKKAYLKLYHLGIARSVEVWQNGKLVGGLYGLLMGKVFFGESMFHLVTDASKVALWHWVDYLIDKGVELIDVQQETQHMYHMGARLVSRESFITLLNQLIE